MKRIHLIAAVLAVVTLAFAGSALADGTETLGPPSVVLADGTNVVVAGLGTQAFPNVDRALSFSVPAGATVKQVLLYWGGHWTDHAEYWANVPQVDGDDVISVNGAAVTGAKIGGSTAFFTQSVNLDATEKFVAYRADITSRGLVGAGSNTLTISNMSFASNFPAGLPFNQGNDGVGVLVIYENGTDSTIVGVRDGHDLAFANFASPLDTTVPQTLTFAPSAAPRPATLSTMAGSVAGPDLGGLRGNVLRVSFDVGGSVDFVNPWGSNNGAEFDAVQTSVTIPAGASSGTVQALSQGGDFPASFAWIAAALTIENPPSTGGGEGCTPGYWKNHDGSKKSGNAWAATPYTTGQLLSTVFSPTGLGSLDSYTLRQALDFGGGSSLLEKKQLLVHHAVAALLNAAHPDVSYPMTVAQITSAVNAALESNDEASILALKDQLDRQNNAGCPLGKVG